MLSLGFAYSLSLVIIAAFFKALGLAGGQVSLQAECIRRVDEDRSGVAASTYYIGADIGNGIGPMVGGTISVCLIIKLCLYQSVFSWGLRCIYLIFIRENILAKIILDKGC